jgi:hypothetical protein
MSDTEAGQNGDTRPRVAFDYIKSQHFRVLHADGVIGSLTPPGNLHAVFFSERPAIPRRVVHALDESGQLGAPLPSETVSRDSIVREADVDIHMSLPVARALRDWLGQRIAEAEATLSVAPPGRG